MNPSKLIAHEQLRERIESYREPEARALIYFLIDLLESKMVNLPPRRARETVAGIVLDFLADSEGKLEGNGR